MTGNFFWSGLCLGIDRFKQLGNQDDNGTHVIDGREIVGHEKLYDGFAERPVPLSQGGRRLEHSPYVALCERDGDYTWNPNNFPKGDVLRVRRRA